MSMATVIRVKTVTFGRGFRRRTADLVKVTYLGQLYWIRINTSQVWVGKEVDVWKLKGITWVNNKPMMLRVLKGKPTGNSPPAAS